MSTVKYPIRETAKKWGHPVEGKLRRVCLDEWGYWHYTDEAGADYVVQTGIGLVSMCFTDDNGNEGVI